MMDVLEVMILLSHHLIGLWSLLCSTSQPHLTTTQLIFARNVILTVTVSFVYATYAVPYHVSPNIDSKELGVSATTTK